MAPPMPADAPALPPPARLRPARLRPKDAATLIIVDREAGSPKVLMGRRSPALAFMPGAFVFPGGRVEASDRAMPATGSLDGRTLSALEARLTKGTPSPARALALAAVRETFEETGLLVGRPVDTMPPGPRDGAWRPFFERQVLPDLSDFRFVGRAITPPGRVRRFDARFFAVDRRAVAASDERRIGPDCELVELRWVDIADTRDLRLHHVTTMILDHLKVRIASDFGGGEPIPFRYQRHGRKMQDDL